MKKITLVFLFLIFITFSSSSALAQSPPPQETLEGTVIKIINEKTDYVMDKEMLKQIVEVSVNKGSDKGKNITINTGDIDVATTTHYKKGDNVVILKTKDYTGNTSYFITDYVRRTPLYILFVIFVLLTLIIGRWRGLSSLVGMIISFFIIFQFIIPALLKGNDPVLVAVLGSLVIIPVTFYLSHGLNRKTTVSVASTLVALVCTGVIAQIFVYSSKLTGFGHEEAAFVQTLTSSTIDMKGLLLAGIIIGVSGILDDVTISQAALIEELHKTNKKLKFLELFKKGMNVGRDHIASLVNTLILVYAGASLPLLILFVNNPHPFSEIVNYEMIANEIIRMLVGSIGLILAVPISTFISAYFVDKHIEE